jgi:hypothetical protein
MATTEERMKILNLIREGKITAEEGAKLLSALGDSQKPKRTPATRAAGEPRWFRVKVTDLVSGNTKVSVNIPFGLMEWGMQIGAQFAPVRPKSETLISISSRKPCNPEWKVRLLT